MFKKWFSVVIIALALVTAGITQLPTKTYAQGEGECWAVIVGISEYQQLNDLRYGDDDARELSQMLSPAWGQDHVKLLVDSGATKANILAAIDWLAEKDDAGDTVLFSFSGHGSSSGYICPYDSLRTSYANDIRSTALAQRLNNLDASRVVVILDTCHAGVFATALSNSGKVLLMACRANETSAENSTLENGIFTYYILQALDEFTDTNQDYELSAEEVFQYAGPETTSFTTVQHPTLSDQHPVLSDSYSGELGLLVEFVFKTNPDILAGTQILVVDNQPYLSGSPPLLCAPGSTHELKVLSPADTGKGTRYVFTSWGDGNTSPSITAANGGVYEARFRTEYQLTIKSALGEPQGGGWYQSGSTATLSMASTEETGGPGVRYTFTGWSGDYTGTETTASLTMNSPKTVTAKWQTEYLLTIESDHGKPEGGGWYKADGTAAISAPSSTGIIIRYIFTGWSGDYTGTETTASLTMNSPKTVTAKWRTDYTQLYILIAGLMALAAVAIIILRIRRRRAAAPVAKMEFVIPAEERKPLSQPEEAERLAEEARQAKEAEARVKKEAKEAERRAREEAAPATAVPPVAGAKLMLPDNSKIQLTGTIRLIRREDFEKAVSAETLKYISRQHLLISYEGGRYFAEDLDSANGTKINGIDIKGKGKTELKDGDRIDIAGVVTLTFKT